MGTVSNTDMLFRIYGNFAGEVRPHIWIEGTDFKYITSTGVEKSITGTLV